MRTSLRIALAVPLVAATLAVWLDPDWVLSGLPGLSGLPSATGSAQNPAAKLTMAVPRYAGFARDGHRRYEVAAKRGAIEPGSDGISLDEPRVWLDVGDDKKLGLRAATGIFDQKSHTLRMRREVVLTSTVGDVRMSEAVVDMRTNTVVSEQPVEIRSQGQVMRGNRLEVRESGVILIFDGSLSRSGTVLRFDNYALQPL